MTEWICKNCTKPCISGGTFPPMYCPHSGGPGSANWREVKEELRATNDVKCPHCGVTDCGYCGGSLSPKREMKKKTWECHGCEEGPCFKDQEMKPVKCNLSGEPMALPDAWREVKEEPTTPDQSSGKGYQVWHTPFGQIFMPAGWDGKPVEGEMLYLAGECPGCEEKNADIEKLKEEIKSHHKKLINVIGMNHDTCPGCIAKKEEIERLKKANDDDSVQMGRIMDRDVNQLRDEINERDAEIRRLGIRDKSRLVRRAGLEADLGRAYDEIKEKDTLIGDMVRGRDSLEELLEIERKKKEKITLTLTMDREKMDSFLALYPNFKPKEPSQ